MRRWLVAKRCLSPSQRWTLSPLFLQTVPPSAVTESTIPSHRHLSAATTEHQRSREGFDMRRYHENTTPWATSFALSFSTKRSDSDTRISAYPGDEDATGPAEIKKLHEDEDLQGNLDEEKEGREIAEEMVQSMENQEEEKNSDSDSDDEASESVSVMHRVLDVDVFLAREEFHGETLQAGRARPQSREQETERGETSLAQLASDRRRRLFWEYMENPSKKKHLLNEILLPKSLDEGEEFGIDKADMVKSEDFADFLVDVRTSQKAVQSGAILRYRAMMVVGNFQGIVGFGLGKASTIQGAIQRARRLALKNLITIPLYRQHTIYDAASAKVTATKVLMWPRSRGFGVVANPILYGCCDLIGIRDMSVKVIGSKNRFNMIKAFFAALESIPSALEVAEEKGVYMREVCLFRPPRTLDSM